MKADEKISIIREEYDISTSDELREDVNVMCNLGEGIEEMAIERTTKEVTKEMNEGFVMNMYRLGYTFDQISQATKLNIDEVKKIIEKNVH